MNYKINRYLDHAVLKPELTVEEVKEAIQMGIDYKVKTVCVRPCDIDLAVEMCRNTETEVACVLAFPHGVSLSEIKAEEAKYYISKGVKEIDMVANYSYIKSKKWDLAKKDIEVVTSQTRISDVLLKVIIETAMLNLEEVAKATEIAIEAGADFVKTSTGFYGEGATEQAVKVMLDTAAGRIKVKPSGGIRDFNRAKMFIDMGCHRLGVGYTSVPKICRGSDDA